MKHPNYAWTKRTTPLTDEEIAEIRQQHQQGVNRNQLARQFRTSWSSINRVVHNKLRFQHIHTEMAATN